MVNKIIGAVLIWTVVLPRARLYGCRYQLVPYESGTLKSLDYFRQVTAASSNYRAVVNCCYKCLNALENCTAILYSPTDDTCRLLTKVVKPMKEVGIVMVQDDAACSARRSVSSGATSPNSATYTPSYLKLNNVVSGSTTIQRGLRTTNIFDLTVKPAAPSNSMLYRGITDNSVLNSNDSQPLTTTITKKAVAESEPVAEFSTSTLRLEEHAVTPLSTNIDTSTEIDASSTSSSASSTGAIIACRSSSPSESNIPSSFNSVHLPANNRDLNIQASTTLSIDLSSSVNDTGDSTTQLSERSTTSSSKTTISSFLLEEDISVKPQSGTPTSEMAYFSATTSAPIMDTFTIGVLQTMLITLNKTSISLSPQISLRDDLTNRSAPELAATVFTNVTAAYLFTAPSPVNTGTSTTASSYSDMPAQTPASVTMTTGSAFATTTPVSFGLSPCSATATGDRRMKWLSVGYVGVWAIDEVDSVLYLSGSYNQNTCTTGTWLSVPLSPQLMNVDVGKSSVWGIGLDGYILHRSNISADNPMGSQWIHVDGWANQVTVSDIDDSVWIVLYTQLYARQNISQSSPVGLNWLWICNGISFADIGMSGLWAVSDGGVVMYANGSRNSSLGTGTLWTRLLTGFSQVASGFDEVCATAFNGSLYCLLGTSAQTPLGTRWVAVGTSVRQVQLSSHGSMWGTKKNGQIYTQIVST